MPKVDPNTKEIITDDPGQMDPDLAGGKTTRETVSSESEFSLKTPFEKDYHSAVLPGERENPHRR